MSIFCIGVVTAIIGDVASHFGATLGIADSVTAITFVALGTSVPGKRVTLAFHCCYTSQLTFSFCPKNVFGPNKRYCGHFAFACCMLLFYHRWCDCYSELFSNFVDTFASKVAAIQDKNADASVGNVTGSNAVNVFLGIGVAWSMAAIYHGSRGATFNVDPGRSVISPLKLCQNLICDIPVSRFPSQYSA